MISGNNCTKVPTTVMDSTFKFNLLSLNVRGLKSDAHKRQSLFHWLKKHNDTDSIIFLQETHSTENCTSNWCREWGSDIHFSHGSSDSKGVAIAFPASLDITVTNKITDQNGRYLLLDCLIEGTRFILVNIYAPTKNHVPEQCLFLEEVLETLRAYSGENLVLGGDFNTVLDPLLDKKGGRLEPVSQYMLNLQQLMDEYGLIDIWRQLNPDSTCFTFHTSGTPLIFSRLDFWLVSSYLSPFVNTCEIKPSIKTDHSIISLRLQGSLWQKRGPGFWKFNSNLLHDP